jgi:hypothetical protein
MRFDNEEKTGCLIALLANVVFIAIGFAWKEYRHVSLGHRKRKRGTKWSRNCPYPPCRNNESQI